MTDNINIFPSTLNLQASLSLLKVVWLFLLSLPAWWQTPTGNSPVFWLAATLWLTDFLVILFSHQGIPMLGSENSTDPIKYEFPSCTDWLMLWSTDRMPASVNDQKSNKNNWSLHCTKTVCRLQHNSHVSRINMRWEVCFYFIVLFCLVLFIFPPPYELHNTSPQFSFLSLCSGKAENASACRLHNRWFTVQSLDENCTDCMGWIWFLFLIFKLWKTLQLFWKWQMSLYLPNSVSEWVSKKRPCCCIILFMLHHV